MNKIKYKPITAQGLNDFKFFKVPNALLTDPQYKNVSFEGAILYGLLRDRMDLSLKNTDRYTDELGRVYIEYTVKELCETLHISESKCKRVLKTLVGSDLVHIERDEHTFAGRNRVYVKTIRTAPSRDGFYTEETATTTDGFIPVPFLLLQDTDLETVSLYAKGLYSALLNRRVLSENNDKYIDKFGIPFVIYSKEEVMRKFGVASEKAVKMVKELEDTGLILRKKINDVKLIESVKDKEFKNLKVIYVNDFRKKTYAMDSDKPLSENASIPGEGDSSMGSKSNFLYMGSESNFSSGQNRTYHGFNSELSMGPESNFSSGQNRTFHGFNSELSMGSKSNPIRLNKNNPDLENPELNNPDINNPYFNYTEREDTGPHPEEKGMDDGLNNKLGFNSSDGRRADGKKAYGKRRNVMLTDEEYDELELTYLHHEMLIEKVSLIFELKERIPNPSKHMAYCEKIAMEDGFVTLDGFQNMKKELAAVRGKSEETHSDEVNKRLAEIRRRIEMVDRTGCYKE